MIKQLTECWEDFLFIVDEFHKIGIFLPPSGYPFEIFINLKWLEVKPEDGVSETK